MSWFDSIGSMFSGGAKAAKSGAKSAQQGIAGSDNAQGFGKATGLTPYMKMFGMTPAEGAPGSRMATPGELLDIKEGRMPAQPGTSGLGGMWDVMRGRGDSWGSPVSGKNEQNGFEKIVNKDGSSGGYKSPTYQRWKATGVSGGNRTSDIENREKSISAGMMKDAGNNEDGNQTIEAPEIYQPDLSKLDEDDKTFSGTRAIRDAKEIGGKGSGKYENLTGAGSFTDTAWGASSGSEFGVKTKIDPLTGKGVTTLANAYGVVGGEYKTGYRAGAMSDDKRYTADAEAGFVASGGASGQLGLDTKNGLYATGGVGGKVGLYGEANANAKTQSAKIGGVDYDAGIGAHAEVFAGAKAGAGATIGLGPDFIGAKGNIGAFVGAEAAADIHGNLGPLAGKVGASGMVGAGIGADGDISFKDGKFHIGGKMFAALGYGGSLSADMTVDVGAIGKSAYNLGAAGVDLAGQGIDYAGKKINAGADYAGKKISAGADYVGKKVNSGIDYAGKKINSGIDYAGKKLDSAGKAISSGVNTGLDYAGRGLNAVGNAAASTYHGATNAISNAGSSLYNGAASLFSW